MLKADYYLDQEHGDDAADGATPQTAKKTLQAIEAMVKPGDVVYVVGQQDLVRLSGKIIASGSID